MPKRVESMQRLLTVVLLAMWLPGCAIVGIGLAGIAADNIAQGEDSYTNWALDEVCDHVSEAERRADGSCPSAQQAGR